jgi:hypothetical protein
MPNIVNPDFSEEVKPLGPGKHRVRIVDLQLRTGKQHGTRFINWKLETIGDQKVTIYHSTPIEGRGAGMFKQFIQAALNPLYEGGEIDLDKAIGRALVVDTFKDDNYLKVKGMERLPDEEQAAFVGGFEDDIPWNT